MWLKLRSLNILDIFPNKKTKIECWSGVVEALKKEPFSKHSLTERDVSFKEHSLSSYIHICLYLLLKSPKSMGISSYVYQEGISCLAPLTSSGRTWFFWNNAAHWTGAPCKRWQTLQSQSLGSWGKEVSGTKSWVSGWMTGSIWLIAKVYNPWINEGELFNNYSTDHCANMFRTVEHVVSSQNLLLIVERWNISHSNPM